MSERWQVWWQDVERAECRYCMQPPGQRCRDPRGRDCAPHKARKDDAAALGFWTQDRGPLVSGERET